MSNEEMQKVFGDFDPAKYEDETKQRWGKTDAYKESAKRTKSYKKEDWQRIKDEGALWMNKVVKLFYEGVDPTDERAMNLAEEARLAIDKNFYPCSREMHLGLGEMYVADDRFRKYYDDHRGGLANWFSLAIKANAQR